MHGWTPVLAIAPSSCLWSAAIFVFLAWYPNDVDKHILARQTGLSRSQVSNWFINARVRLWKPMVEEMYSQEMKEQNDQSSHAATSHQDNTNPNPNHNFSLNQKPAPGQLLNDSDSLSSIINGSHRSDEKATILNAKNSQDHNPQQQVPRAESFGAVDLDVSSYGSRGNQNLRSGVSLTLGLQQNSGVGMNLSFSPASQNSLLFSREHMDDGQQVQFTILDGEARSLPYRNMMGAQLLHDLAG